MVNFRGLRTMQEFAAAHASTHNRFYHPHILNRRDILK